MTNNLNPDIENNYRTVINEINNEETKIFSSIDTVNLNDYNNMPLPSNTKTINSKVIVKINNDSCCTSFCLKLFFIILILFFGLPLTFCDIYYAYTDHTCVSSHVDKINLTLKDYLVVNGILTGCLLFLMILATIIFTDNNAPYIMTIGPIILVIASLFNVAWVVIGGVIFWGYMDNSLCSNEVYNYVFASLIIKFISVGLGLFSNNNKNKDNKN